ncbi:DUF4376 domain-containing protein [Martelella mediterranea]|uniref:Uncharacterized protein DUF4376 n=1 Tax=Martelella mediterranea TaxID=293089 RepID=A0A4R3NWG8_9HYPH|nr:DUF4376 domain-containing protein [Martelella mediterranea]TCT42997.1 uncharacterized protein DUF4376 [Martelella mediterranea]
MMEFRNPVFSSADNSSIDAEVNHPSLGWIPFTAVNGDESTQEMFDAMLPDAAPYVAPAIRPSQVDEERDRRIADGIVFEGVEYQTRPGDVSRIKSWAAAARSTLEAGATAGDYRWHGQDYDFAWIAADNTAHKMDAATAAAFGDAVLAHEQAHILAARQIKDMNPIPADYEHDNYWPD